MSTVHIRRVHGQSLKKAREAAQRIADELAAEFDIDCEWDGDVLNFKRSGVQGTLSVDKEALEVNAKLGLMVSLLKGRIEQEVHRWCDEQFGA